MKRTIAGVFIAVSLITSAANADVAVFPIAPNDQFEYMGNANLSAWFAEKATRPVSPGVEQYVMIRGRNNGDPPTYVEFYFVDCASYNIRYRFFAASGGDTAAEINDNVVYFGSNPWKYVVGTKPAAVKAKQVCLQKNLLPATQPAKN